MPQITFHKAERKRSKLRLAIAGPSGAGKTYSALLIGGGIVPMDKIAVIDTESGSADLYADLGPYSTLTVTPPYDPQKYIDAIHAAEQAGFELIVIDSLSHAWSGEGGLLDKQGKATDSKYHGNSWAAWREITPQHNQLVETMLHSPCHIIATMRSKTAYEQVTDGNGRKKIEKLGMAPIQRDGIEYEFTTVFDLAINHTAMVSKDRTKLFDGQYFVPSPDTGRIMLGWLNAGSPPAQSQAHAAGIPMSQAPAPGIPYAPQAQQPPVNVDTAVLYGPHPEDLQPTPAPQPQAAPAAQPSIIDVLRKVWHDQHYDDAQSLDAYMASRMGNQYGPGHMPTDQDWQALYAEVRQYLADHVPDYVIDNPTIPAGQTVKGNELPM